MAFPELISYISEQTQQGIPAQVLREALLESGWREYDIENAFHDVAAGLNPLTEGASLHEDVSQVRSMVTHLAARIKNLEAVLASAGVLPMQSELPAGLGDPSRTLSSAQNPRGALVIAFLSVGLISVVASWLAMAVFIRQSLAPFDQATIAEGIGVASLIIGLVMMRMRYAWSAALWVGTSIVVWATTIWLAWRDYQAMEWTTALALGVLLIVLALVVGRRIDRR